MAIYPYCYYIVKIPSVPRKRGISVNLTEYPWISVVINVYLEGELVKTRIDDILCSDYPKNRMRVYLVNDGADKDTSMAASEIVEKLQNTEFHIIETKKRLGKTACQNLMLVNTPDEIVVFTDADIPTRTDALSRLVSVLQLAVILCECVLVALILIKPTYLISSFMLNQFYLLVGLLGRKNILQWGRVEK